MKIVIALGGNALLRRGENLSAETQRTNIDSAAESIAKLVVGNDVVITHGNGPQVGLLALQSAPDASVEPYPLDVLGAESQGMVGYLLLESLSRLLPDHRLSALLTRVVVRESDPAFAHPTKPIGPVYDQRTAEELARHRGWTTGRDGKHWRRLVASPKPIEVIELPAINALLAHGFTVVCAGGGGIPMAGNDAHLKGVEAVVDKDLTSLLVALGIGADMFVMLTDVQGVAVDWGGEKPEFMRHATPSLLKEMTFEAGSMAPKVAAATRFVERTGNVAAIGRLTDAIEIVSGLAGTRIEPD